MFLCGIPTLKDSFVFPACLLTQANTLTRKLEIASSICTHPFCKHTLKHTFTHTHSSPMWFSGGLPQNLSSVSSWLVQGKWRRTEECSPSKDALLWVWRGTKAVSTQPQLVMDAMSLFKTPRSPLSVCTAHHSLQEPQCTLPAGQKGWSNP